MAVGLEVSKNHIDDVVGVALRDLNVVMRRLKEIKDFLDGMTDADLVALGYTNAEVSGLKSAFADMAQLGQIYVGNANLTNAKDFRTFAKRLWGLGTV